ncbi:MAG: RHS repeat protein, partial [Actinobacteria bacterium]|nr:RHS repeat protein [Actinomycetota bacterium]
KVQAPGIATGTFDVTSYTYDALGNPLTVKSPSANAGDATNPGGLVSVNSYTYDNLIASTSNPIASGSYRTTVYGYTPSGQKASTDVGTCASTDTTQCVPGNAAWHEGRTQRYTYAPDGLNIAQLGTNQAAITTSYDQAGRPVTIADAKSGITISASYYLDGLLRTASDGTNSNTYAYNGAGSPTVRTDATGSSGITAGVTKTTSYAYNDADLPSQMSSDVSGGASNWTYNPAGLVTGRSDTAGGHSQSTAIAYNPDNTINTDAVSSGGTTLAKNVYTYDDGGDILTDAVSGSAQSFTNSYVYNPAGNITSFTQGSTTTSYTWDHDANRLTATQGGSTTTWAYSADNTIKTSQTTGDALVTYHYDTAGELTQTDANSGADVCSTATYDDFGRTASQGQPADTACGNTVNKGTTTYTYDGLDRQQAAVVTGAGNSSADTTTHSSFDGLSTTLVGQTGAVDGTYTNPTTLYELAADGTPLAISQGSIGLSYLNNDGQNNVTSLTNADNSIACAANYDPFGNPILGATPPANGNGVCASGPSTTGANPTTTANAAWYRGESRDPNYGTYQLGTRTYNPASNSFSTPDTSRVDTPSQDLSVGTDPLTQNTYTYVNGNPVNYDDPDGHRLIGDYGQNIPYCYSHVCTAAQQRHNAAAIQTYNQIEEQGNANLAAYIKGNANLAAYINSGGGGMPVTVDPNKLYIEVPNGNTDPAMCAGENATAVGGDASACQAYGLQLLSLYLATKAYESQCGGQIVICDPTLVGCIGQHSTAACLDTAVQAGQIICMVASDGVCGLARFAGSELTPEEAALQTALDEERVRPGAPINHLNGAMAEELGWQESLANGEIGIQAPGKITATGPDYITYDPDSDEIVVWDAKYSSSGRFPSGIPASQMASWNSRIASVVQDYSGPYAQQIQQAFSNGSVRGQIFAYNGGG